MNRQKRPAALLPRLPSMLGYPLRGGLPWMMVALCLLRLLNHLPGLLGALFEIVFWVMSCKLAVEALTNTAHGRDDPLSLGELAATDGEALRQVLLQILVYIGLFSALHFGGYPGLIAALVATAVLMPAAVMLLSMNGSVFNALNPLGWFALIGRLGGAYFAVVILVAVLMVLSTLAEVYVGEKVPVVGELPATYLRLYSLVLMYHVLGDLIHRHHEKLGLDISPAVPRATYANPLEDETMQSAEAAARDGRPGDAATLLQDLFRGRGASDAVHDRYREFVIAAGDIERLSRHDRDYLTSLVITGKEKRALALAIDTLGRDPQFRLQHDESVAKLVEQAMRTGQVRLGVQLAQGFEEQFPASEHTPQVVHAVAWAMADKYDMATAAMLRLQRAMRAHPQHPLTEKLQALYLQIDRLPKIPEAPKA